MSHTLGAAGLPVSQIGLGLAALGRPGYINLGHADDLHRDYDMAAMQAHTHTVLNAAWEQGVRYFDAARSYGRAEQFLGSWLQAQQPPHDAITVGSKWGYTYTANWQTQAAVHEVKEHSLTVLQRQWAESQTFLGGYLRLYQVHSATLDSGIFSNQDVLHELARLKDQGIAIGLTLSGAKQGETLRHALTTQVAGKRLFDTVQVTWNLLERSTSEALQQAHDAGIGVIIKEALANGRLTTRNQEPGFAATRAVLTEQAERLNTTIDALALAGVLAQPWADVVLSGAATVPQLTSNLKALDVQWDDEAEVQVRQITEPPEVYWDTRKNLAWN
ncbi:MAG: aldo/keto reductase [Anaerolineae bacterium]|nr:aldo/keto reductase [Anaerolineae bacterium]